MSKNPYTKGTPILNEPEPGDAPPAYSPSSSSAPNTGKSSSFGGEGKDSGKLAVPGASMSNSSAISLMDEQRELPEGWIRQWDPTQKHHFYVDTKANPPRSIWVHPYDDPTYIASIPDKAPVQKFAPPPGPPPGETKGASGSKSASGSSSSGQQQQKGFFGNIKNKLQGTPDERERRKLEAQRREAEMRRQYEQRQQEIQNQGYPSQYGPQQGYGPQGGYYPQQQGGYYGQQPGYGPQPYYQPQYAPPQVQYVQRSSGFGGGGMALPLLGGLAGGFLLGDIIGDAGDGGGDGGDW